MQYTRAMRALYGSKKRRAVMQKEVVCRPMRTSYVFDTKSGIVATAFDQGKPIEAFDDYYSRMKAENARLRSKR